MKKLVMATAMLTVILMSAQAQTKSKLPVTPEKEIVSNLFNIPDSEVHHHYKVELGKGNYLLIDYRYLSDWTSTDSGFFSYIIQTAAKMEQKYEPQMQNNLSSKRLDISLPFGNKPLTARFREWTENTNLQLFTANDNAPLKIGMDTIRVINTTGEYQADYHTKGGGLDYLITKKDQLQYTFLLKEMSQIKELAADEEWINTTAGVLDSVVNTYNNRWKKPNKWYHTSSVTISAIDNNRPKVTNTDILDNVQFVGSSIYTDVSVGISLVRNTLAPNIDIGIVYNSHLVQSLYLSQRFSWSNFYVYDKQANNTYKGYVTSMLNYEIGFGKKGKEAGAVGFGVRIFGSNKNYQDDPSVTRDLYKLFFRTSLTKNFSISPEIYFVPKHKEQNWVGLTLNVHLF